MFFIIGYCVYLVLVLLGSKIKHFFIYGCLFLFHCGSDFGVNLRNFLIFIIGMDDDADMVNFLAREHGADRAPQHRLARDSAVLLG